MAKEIKKPESKIEKRIIKVELRASDKEGEPAVIIGMPIVYNRESEDMGFIEINKKGSAKNAIGRSDARALYGHNSNSLLPIGRQSAGTLRMKDTNKGVEIEIDPPDTEFSRALMIAIERGDIAEMSYAFSIKDDIWEMRDGKEYRTIVEIQEIFDISPVAFAAFPDTTVALRGLDLFTANRDKNKVLENQQEDDTEERFEKILINRAERILNE